MLWIADDVRALDPGAAVQGNVSAKSIEVMVTKELFKIVEVEVDNQDSEKNT